MSEETEDWSSQCKVKKGRGFQARGTESAKALKKYVTNHNHHHKNHQYNLFNIYQCQTLC